MDDPNKLLTFGIATHDLQLVNRALAQGAEISYHNYLPYFLCVTTGTEEIFRHLWIRAPLNWLEHRINLQIIIETAQRLQQHRIVKFLQDEIFSPR